MIFLILYFVVIFICHYLYRNYVCVNYERDSFNSLLSI